MKQYENYISKVTCFNCRKQMRIKIPVGVTVHGFTCPKCGCVELVAGYVTWK